MVDGIYRYNIHFDSQILTADDVRNIYIKHAGRLLQLKDLCQIEECAALRKNFVRHDGKNSVTLAVIKQSDAQMDDLQESSRSSSASTVLSHRVVATYLPGSFV